MKAAAASAGEPLPYSTFMLGRLRVFVIVLVTIVTSAAPAAQANTAWPSRSTPLNSTQGWFKAINAHNRRQLLFYVAPRAREQMGWARPTVPWSKFTDLRCQLRHSPAKSRQADVRCTFQESASPTEGNPDTFWDVELTHTRTGWLIDNYGTG